MCIKIDELGFGVAMLKYGVCGYPTNQKKYCTDALSTELSWQDSEHRMFYNIFLTIRHLIMKRGAFQRKSTLFNVKAALGKKLTPYTSQKRSFVMKGYFFLKGLNLRTEWATLRQV